MGICLRRVLQRLEQCRLQIQNESQFQTLLQRFAPFYNRLLQPKKERHSHPSEDLSVELDHLELSPIRTSPAKNDSEQSRFAFILRLLANVSTEAGTAALLAQCLLERLIQTQSVNGKENIFNHKEFDRQCLA
jgi:hypothetical protein